VSDVLAVFGCVLDDPELNWAGEILWQAVLEGLVSEENISLQEVPSDGVLGGSNDRQFFDFVAV